MPIEWLALICPHRRGRYFQRRSKSVDPDHAVNALETASQNAACPDQEALVEETTAATHRTSSPNVTGTEKVTHQNQNVVKMQQRVSDTCLEIIVSDVHQWKCQITSLLEYVSKRNQLQVDEMQHIWKLRIDKLQQQNEKLLNHLDILGQERERADDEIRQLQMEKEKQLQTIVGLQEKLNGQNAKHETETLTLKRRFLRLQEQNSLIKRVIEADVCGVLPEIPTELLEANRNNGDRPSTTVPCSKKSKPMHKESSPAMQCPTSNRRGNLQPELQTLQMKVDTIATELEGTKKRSLRTASSRLAPSHQSHQTHFKKRDATSSPRAHQTSPSNLLPKTPLQQEAPLGAFRASNNAPIRDGQQSMMKTVTAKTPSQSQDPTPRRKNTADTSPSFILRLQPSWRP